MKIDLKQIYNLLQLFAHI